MAFFLPLIVGLSKVAGGQAMGQVARKAAVGAGKQLLSNRRGGGGGGGRGQGGGGEGQGGSIIRTSRGAVAQTPMVGGFIMQSPETPNKVSIKKITKVTYKSVGSQLTSIESVCKSIEQITGQTIKDKQKRALNARKAEEKNKKLRREEKNESGGGGGALGFLGGAAKSAGNQFGIFNFLTNMLMGIMALGVLKLLPQITSSIQWVGTRLHLCWLGIKGIGLAFKAIKPGIIKGLTKVKQIFKSVAKPFKNSIVGLSNGIKRTFKSLSNKIPKIITGSINYAKSAVRYGAGVVKNAGSAVRTLGMTKAPSKSLGKSATALNRLMRSSVSATTTSSSQSIQGALLLRKNHGDEAARMYKGLVDNGMDPTKAANYVKKQIGLNKITSKPMAGSLGGGMAGSNVLKGGATRSIKRSLIGGLGRNGFRTLTSSLRRIPIIGPLIVGVVSLLSGEPAAQALFKAGGAALGGFLGTFIPIPIIGTLLGELIGEYVGDLMYTATMGGGVGALGTKLQNDISNMLKAGSVAMGWMGDGLGRLYEGIPKFKIPEFLGRDFILNPLNELLKGFGGNNIQDYEIPNPLWFANPLNFVEKLGLVYKAFFTRDPMKEGSVSKKNPKNKEQPTNNSNSPGSPSSTNLSAPAQESFRPGSDALADKVKIAPSSSSSKTEYNSAGGNNKRRIFLHWSAGSYTNPYDAYHTIFMGNGKAVRNTPYGVNKSGHTGGGNTGSIGLSVAAMDGGTENAKSWPTPPKQIQIDAMTSEAAQIAVDWGYSNADVDNLIMTHGEWERYGTRNGILSGRPERWDFDKLKPSDPRIDTSNVKSYGGNQLRSMIKAKMNAIKNGNSSIPEEQKPSAQSTQAQAKQSQPTTPMVRAKKKTFAILCYGTNDWGLSESRIKLNAIQMIKALKNKGYNVVVVPPNKELIVKGMGKKPAPYKGVYSAASEEGVIIEQGVYEIDDSLHLELSFAKKIHNKYKPAIYVGDSNAVRIKGAMGAGFANTTTAVSGSGSDAILGQIRTSVQSQKLVVPDEPVSEDGPRSANPDADIKAQKKVEDNARLGSPSTDSSNQTLSASAKRIQAMRQAAFDEVMGTTNGGGTRSQNPDADLTGGIKSSPSSSQPSISSTTSPSSKATSVEAQASYEQFLGATISGGGLKVVPIQQNQSSGSQSSSRGGGINSGSGDLLNSYYKSQLMGHLYKYG